MSIYRVGLDRDSIETAAIGSNSKVIKVTIRNFEVFVETVDDLTVEEQDAIRTAVHSASSAIRKIGKEDTAITTDTTDVKAAQPL